MKLRQLTLLACALAIAAAAHGEDRFFLAGGEAADSDYYTYLGVSMPLGPRKDGRGFVQRYWLDRFGYEYDSGSRRIEADVWGGEAAVGYAWSSPRGWSEISAGVRYTDTDLSPDDPSADARATQAIARVTVVDGLGQAVSGATVAGTWSGVVTSGDGSRVTDAAGTATFYSSRTRTPGTVNFCVINITSNGRTYDSAANLESCEAIVK